MAFALKVNADIERVADHACSIAKVSRKLDAESPPRWPTALAEMGQRVPMMCHALLRALVEEDADAAKAIIATDKTIDSLHKRLFEETVELLESQTQPQAVGLFVYRVGRELERIGDLMCNIAEDIVYLSTGEIIRHQKRRAGAAEAEPEGLPER
jgi:phosphate transport system protein